MRKIILNPQYKSLYTFIETLPQNFNAGGEIVQDRRNTIKKFKVNGLEINVKRYRVPILINRIAYRFFRKSKAVKAYFNSLEFRFSLTGSLILFSGNPKLAGLTTMLSKSSNGDSKPLNRSLISKNLREDYYIIVIISACNALTDGKSGNTTRDRYRAMKL